MAQVVDYVARPGAAALAAAGIVGAVRYVAPLPNPKCVTAAEVADFAAHGLALAFVFESYASRPNEGASAGTADARTAVAQVQALGAARGTCIYMAIDEGAAPSLWPTIAAYLDAAGQIIRAAGFRLGGYGDAPLGMQMLADRHVDLWWETVAWSGSVRIHDLRCPLFQTGAQPTINGAPVDLNDVLQPDWGQWTPGAPAPTPAPTPPQGDDPMILTPSWATIDPSGRVPFYEVLQGNDVNTLVVFSYNGAPLDRVDGVFDGQWFQRQSGTTGPVRGLVEVDGVILACCHGGGGGVYRIADRNSTGHP